MDLLFWSLFISKVPWNGLLKNTSLKNVHQYFKKCNFSLLKAVFSYRLRTNTQMFRSDKLAMLKNDDRVDAWRVLFLLCIIKTKALHWILNIFISCVRVFCLPVCLYITFMPSTHRGKEWELETMNRSYSTCELPGESWELNPDPVKSI